MTRHSSMKYLVPALFLLNACEGMPPDTEGSDPATSLNGEPGQSAAPAVLPVSADVEMKQSALTAGKPIKLHRTLVSCQGTALGPEQVIDLVATPITGYTCGNRFQEQCINDGTFDSFYYEWCEYETPCSRDAFGIVTCRVGSTRSDLGSPIFIHRDVYKCDGTVVSKNQLINANGYSNYTCGDRFTEACIQDGSFDGYYIERCDYKDRLPALGKVAAGTSVSLPTDPVVIANPERYLGRGRRAEVTSVGGEISTTEIVPTTISLVNNNLTYDGVTYQVVESQSAFNSAIDKSLDVAGAGKYGSLSANVAFATSVKNTTSISTKTSALIISARVTGRLKLETGHHSDAAMALLNQNSVSGAINFNQSYGNMYIDTALLGGTFFYIFKVDYSQNTSTSQSEVNAKLQLAYSDVANGTITGSEKTKLDTFFQSNITTGYVVTTTGLSISKIVSNAQEFSDLFAQWIEWYRAAAAGDASKPWTTFDYTLQPYWMLTPNQYGMPFFRKEIKLASRHDVWGVFKDLVMDTTAWLYTNGECIRNSTITSKTYNTGLTGIAQVIVNDAAGAPVFSGVTTEKYALPKKSTTLTNTEYVPAKVLSPNNQLTIIQKRK